MRGSWLWAALIAAMPACEAADTMAAEPATAFEDAVAVWDMASRHDSAGADSALPSDRQYGVALSGAAKEASLKRGGDGEAVRLRDEALSAGQGAEGELNLRGDAMTMLLRLKNATDNWDRTLFSKHGGHDRLLYNLFAFNLDGGRLDLSFELGTDEGVFKAATIIPADRTDGWHDVIVRYDGERLQVFFDGELRETVPASGELRRDNPVPAVIGGEPVVDGRIIRKFNGWIDHAALWDRALSKETIHALSGGKRETDKPAIFAEPYRPRYHFSARENWINDPNGLVYHDGQYHLFFQHNPFGMRWGHMSWGHATADDLVHWRHQAVALPEANNTMIFSGSAVFDEKNTSGFGTSENPPLVAIYTGHETDTNIQQQSLAYSLDGGKTWTKYDGNPVLDIGSKAFRDPKVFWHEASEKWVMAIAMADARQVRFYGSDDLKAWRHLSDFGPAGQADVPNWECPEMFRLPVQDTDEHRWVLQVDVGDHAVAGGSGGQYFIGRFDGERFHNANPSDKVLWADYGMDFYAAQAWNNVPASDGRRIWIAWMNCWAYANHIPTTRWRGAMTLPRRVMLRQTEAGPRLIQRPVRELKQRRRDAVTLDRQTIAPGDDPLGDAEIAGRQLEIVARFRPQSAERFGLRVREGEDQHTVIGYDTSAREVYVDRRDSGRDGFSDEFADVHRAPLKPRDGVVTLRIFVDQSSVEVFANGGRRSITDLIFPDPSSTGLSLFSEGGSVELASATVYRLAPVFEAAEE